MHTFKLLYDEDGHLSNSWASMISQSVYDAKYVTRLSYAVWNLSTAQKQKLTYNGEVSR